MSLESELLTLLSDLPSVIISEAHLAQIITLYFQNETYDVYAEVPFEIESSFGDRGIKTYYVDLCLVKDQKVSLIELKFKTKSDLDRLKGHFLHEHLTFAYKNHKAVNLATHSFWKDVVRLEEIKKKLHIISDCFSVFVSNDSCYFKRGKSKYNWLKVSIGNSEVFNGEYSFNAKESLKLEKNYRVKHIHGGNWKSSVVTVN
jgi:hypothetical protein